MTRLYIGNVSSKGEVEELKELLSECGKIKFFDVKEGSGYMEYETPEESEEAIKKFHGYDFNGKNLIVESARRMVPRGGHRGGRRFNHGRDRDHRRSRSISSSRSRSRDRNRRRRTHHERSRSASRSFSSRSRSRSRDRNHRRKSRRSRSRS